MSNAEDIVTDSKARQYDKTYCRFMKRAMYLCSKTGRRLLTTRILFHCLLHFNLRYFEILLKKKCIVPPFPDCKQSRKKTSEVICSREVYRYLSVYGGIVDELLNKLHYPYEITAFHLAAALLWKPTEEVKDFLQLNSIDYDNPNYQDNIEEVAAKLSEKYAKKDVKKNRDLIRSRLQRIRLHLEATCFGQKEVIRSIISNLLLFWLQTETERNSKPLSFFFIGCTGSGKSHVAIELRKILHKELKIAPIPIIDMSRYSQEQSSIDLIGRDSAWRDNGTEGSLTSPARDNPNGLLVIENFDKGHLTATVHIETVISNGVLKDNFYGDNVSFAKNIVILISNKGSNFFDSDDYFKLCKNNSSEGIPRDKLINGICSTLDKEDAILANSMRMALSKCDVPLFFQKHNTNSLQKILEQAILSIEKRLKNLFNVKLKYDLKKTVFFFLETIPQLDSAHGICQMVESILFIPIQDRFISKGKQSEKETDLTIVLDDLPELDADFGSFEPYSEEWMEARTSKRIQMAKRLDYKQTLDMESNPSTFHFYDLCYQVMPSIEDAGFFTVQPSDVRFDDLVGLSLPRLQIGRAMAHFRNPEKVLKPETGILLCGPPGTGKTSFAKAVANELGVPFISISGSDLSVAGVVGVRHLFERARRYSAVLFIDEIDAIGSRNTSKSKDLVINTLLTELDGYSERRTLVIGATNRKDMLDEALLRAGRLHAIIEIGLLQNKNDRAKLIELTCKKAQVSIEDKLKSFIVDTTNDWSPAALVSVIREMLFFASQENRDPTREDFVKARNVEFFGLSTQNQQLSTALRRQVAIHESGHALVACLQNQPFVQVTIQENDNILGFVEPISDGNTFYTEESFLKFINLRLAGYAAETILSKPSEGSKSDFQQATFLANRLIQSGFGKIQSYAVSPFDDPKTDLLKNWKEIQTILQERMEITKKLLNKHRQVLIKIVDRLEKEEILFQDDVKSIVHESKRKGCTVS